MAAETRRVTCASVWSVSANEETNDGRSRSHRDEQRRQALLERTSAYAGRRDQGGRLRRAPRGVHPQLAGIKIVDCDTHFTEPPEIFTSRAPAHLKDKAPDQAVADGITRWFVEGQDYGIVGGNVICQDKRKLLGRLSFPTINDGTDAAWQVKPLSRRWMNSAYMPRYATRIQA